ncbi:MAG: hypothetical protein Q9227_006789 [Pyrenula ochraceoflavens]
MRTSLLSSRVSSLRYNGWICRSCARRRRLFATSRPAFASKKKGVQTVDLTVPARTRFAPSPTGDLHLGSLRTALYNFLLARRTGGQFILRIEDTDQNRTIEGSLDKIQKDLTYYGLNWDEGPGVGGPYSPYVQSSRTDIYRQFTTELLSSQHAYRCFCSTQRLQDAAVHRHKMGLPPGYDRTCFSIEPEESDERAHRGEKYVVRFKAPTENLIVPDLVMGNVHYPADQKKAATGVFDDQILIKRDGRPTYHFANVVDDHLMKITHVIRGSEWLPSTPLHISLHNAFGWTPPVFGHVSLLVDEFSDKLSKRDQRTNLDYYKRPVKVDTDVLLNFVALLGWSHREKSDVMDLKEMIEKFTPKFTRGNTMVTLSKLNYLQIAHTQRAIQESDSRPKEFQRLVDDISQAATEQFTETQLSLILGHRNLKDYVAPLVRADVKAFSKLKEAGENIEYPPQSFRFHENHLKWRGKGRKIALAEHATLRFPTAEDFLTRNKSFFQPLEGLKAKLREEIQTVESNETVALAMCLIPDTHWTKENLHDNIEASLPPRPLEPPKSEHQQPLDPQDLKKQALAEIVNQIESDPNDDLGAWKAARRRIYSWLRWALLGSQEGPSLPDAMVVLGREVSIRRLREAVEVSRRVRGEREGILGREKANVEVVNDGDEGSG